MTKSHELCFICISKRSIASAASPHAMQQEFGIGRWIWTKCKIICVVCVCHIFYEISCLPCLFLRVKPFSFIKSIDVHSTSSRQIINIYATNVIPCKNPASMSKKLIFSSDEQTLAFVFIESIIIAVAVSFWRLYVRIICSFFPLCIKSNILEKSTNKCSLRFLRVLLQWFNEYSDYITLWINFFKNSSDFSKNTHNLWSDTIKKPSILILSNNCHNSYATIVLNNYEVAFLGESDGTDFYLFLYCVACPSLKSCDHIYYTGDLFILVIPGKIFWKGLAFMVYQPLRFIKCQSHPCRTVVLLYKI